MKVRELIFLLKQCPEEAEVHIRFGDLITESAMSVKESDMGVLICDFE